MIMLAIVAVVVMGALVAWLVGSSKLEDWGFGERQPHQRAGYDEPPPHKLTKARRL